MQSLLDPTILCFVIGLTAGLLKSDLRLPKSSYDFVSLYLLLAIGLKGGVQLSETNLNEFSLPFFGTLSIGVLIPVLAFRILRFSSRLTRADCGAIAAHYGSVSAVTFATAITFLANKNISYEAYMPTLLVVLEIPAIALGIYLAKGDFQNLNTKKQLISEILFGKSIFLLGGGLLIGYVAGPERIKPVEPLFFDLFKGFLALFLLELGVLTSQQMTKLKEVGLFLLVFGIGMPLISGLIGALVGHYLLGLSTGGAYLLSILSASSSYIAAPSAMSIAVPEANSTYYLTSSLAITFPFNITIGIPLFYDLITSL